MILRKVSESPEEAELEFRLVEGCGDIEVEVRKKGSEKWELIGFFTENKNSKKVGFYPSFIVDSLKDLVDSSHTGDLLVL